MQETHIGHLLSINAETMQQMCSHIPDFVIKKFTCKHGNHAFIAYLRGVSDEKELFSSIIHPLVIDADTIEQARSIIEFNISNQADEWQVIGKAVSSGYSVLFIENEPSAFIMGTVSWPTIKPQESQFESTLKGSRVGFAEESETNISMLRYMLPQTNLQIKEFTVGSISKTKVSMVYIADEASPEGINEMKSRIRSIEIDGFFNIGELTEHLEDDKYALIPQFIITERPDLIAANLLEGKIAVLAEHSSHVLVGPATFLSFFYSMDDYNIRWPVVSFIRLLRYFGILIAVFLPALYIATVSFHYEIIPIDLVLPIGKSLEQVPFPPLIEAMVMELILEMLREAGLRLPTKVGQTVGIVGGIVIGQAAIQASLVSNIMVIVVAFTAIASFIQPNQDMAAAIRLLRFPFMLLAYLLGLVGIVIGIMILASHMLSLSSLNVSYTSPLMPLRLNRWKEEILRLPLKWFKK